MHTRQITAERISLIAQNTANRVKKYRHSINALIRSVTAVFFVSFSLCTSFNIKSFIFCTIVQSPPRKTDLSSIVLSYTFEVFFSRSSLYLKYYILYSEKHCIPGATSFLFLILM